MAMRIKYLLILLLSFLRFFSIQAQQEDRVYTLVDQMPYFEGCEVYADGSSEKQDCSNHTLVSYVRDALIYPEIAQHENLEGIVYISFIVNEQGKVLKPTILTDIGGGCGAEAIRVVREMPNWQPGRLRGEAVKVQLRLPIEFSFSRSIRKEDYTFRWGSLETYQVSKKEIKKNLDQKAQIFDLEGTSVSIASLTFSSNKRNKTLSAKSSGNITSQMKKLVKKLRKGSLFSVIATIQIEGDFVELDKEFIVI